MQTCMKLHNICIDKNVAVPLTRYHEDVREGNEWRVHDNTRDDDEVFRERAVGDHRRKITTSLENCRNLRPIHASMNSRCN